jgi:hypothetical protein
MQQQNKSKIFLRVGRSLGTVAGVTGSIVGLVILAGIASAWGVYALEENAPPRQTLSQSRILAQAVPQSANTTPQPVNLSANIECKLPVETVNSSGQRQVDYVTYTNPTQFVSSGQLPPSIYLPDGQNTYILTTTNTTSPTASTSATSNPSATPNPNGSSTTTRQRSFLSDISLGEINPIGDIQTDPVITSPLADVDDQTDPVGVPSIENAGSFLNPLARTSFQGTDQIAQTVVGEVDLPQGGLGSGLESFQLVEPESDKRTTYDGFRGTSSTMDMGLLDGANPQILPDSPLYGFKQLGRSISGALSFSPLQKVYHDLKTADEEVAETVALLDKEVTEQNLNLAYRRLESATNRVNEVVQFLEDTEGDSRPGTMAARELTANYLDNWLTHQSVIELVEAIDPLQFENLENLRVNHLADTVKAVETLNDETQVVVAQLLNRNTDTLAETLQTLEKIQEIKTLSTDSQAGLFSAVEGQLVSDIEGRLIRLDGDLRRKELSEYVVTQPGNLLRRLAALNEIRRGLNNPELAELVYELEDTTLTRLLTSVKGAQSEEGLDGALALLNNGDVGSLQLLKQVERGLNNFIQVPQAGLDLESTQAYLQQTKDQLRNTLQNDVVTQLDKLEAEQILRQIAARPTVDDLELVSEIVAISDASSASPQIKQLLHGFENQVQQKVVQRLAITPQLVMRPIPETATTLTKLKQVLPQSNQATLNRALRQHESSLEHYLLSGLKDRTAVQGYQQQLTNTVLNNQPNPLVSSPVTQQVKQRVEQAVQNVVKPAQPSVQVLEQTTSSLGKVLPAAPSVVKIITPNAPVLQNLPPVAPSLPVNVPILQQNTTQSAPQPSAEPAKPLLNLPLLNSL